MANESTPEQPPSNAITEQPPAPPEAITAQPSAPSAPQEAITAAPATPAAPVTPTPDVPAPATPSIQSVSAAWPLKVDLAIFGLLLVLTFLVGSFVATNSDVWSHLAIGKSISEGSFTFGQDPHSWLSEATEDRPASVWVHQSWLYSWIFYQLHESIGGQALVVIKALLFTIAILLLSRIGWNEANRWFILIALVIAAITVSPRLMLQPIVVSFLFLSITLYVLHRAGFFGYASADGKAPCPKILWVLPPLFALWANLDAWFIVGPIVLGLCWAGAGMTRWFPASRVVPAKTLGLVFGAGVLACLLNPYHVRVFQLPPELAYQVVKVTDWSPLKLPDELVGAGRTVGELKRAEGQTVWAISTVSSAYLLDARLGWNIAGWAFAPLIVLSLLGFTLTARIKPQPGAPSFHVGRFLLWLVFGVLALASYRMIPFFVLIAAPLMAMSLGDFLNWQQTVSKVPAEGRSRGLNLARIVTIPFLLLLIYLAWPGWLHGTTDFTSQRHVAWDIRPNASLVNAAQALGTLKKQGQCKNVFNTSYDLADYCCWFAPDVKFGFDNRLALYVGRVSGYTKTRKALEGPETTEWKDYFIARDIDQVTLTNFLRRDARDRRYLSNVHWWLDSETWRQREGDARIVVFSWAGPNRSWPRGQAYQDWNKSAFGAVPKDRRPPENGTLTPQTPGFFGLYLDGVGPTPTGLSEVALWSDRYNVASEEMNGLVNSASRWGILVSLNGIQALPGGMTLVPSWILCNAQMQYAPRGETGPAALPILMMRSVRQAVAENPREARCWLDLVEVANLTRAAQEDRWVGNVYLPGKLRDRMRQLQILTGLRAASQLQPENSDLHQRLAEFYLQEKLFDLALDHMHAAEKATQNLKPANNEERQFLDAKLKRQQSQIKVMEDVVRQRVAKWKEFTSSTPPGIKGEEAALRKADVAANENIEEVVGLQRVRSPLGLGKKALEILSELKVDSLSPQAQQYALLLQYRLFFAMGQADRVMESLQQESVKKGLPPEVYATNLVLAAGALGDYASAETGLAALEAGIKKGAQQARAASAHAIAINVPSLMHLPKVGSAAAIAVACVLQSPQPLIEMKKIESLLQYQQNELCNTITLRGIMALEAGNTDFARTLFQRAIDQADGVYFTERPIAQRYLALISEQKR